MYRKLSIVFVVIGIMCCMISGIIITTNPTIEKIEFSKSQIVMEINTSQTLGINVLPTNAKISAKDLDWTTSNDEIATVNQLGKVNAVGVGTATISAKYKELSVSCQVTVNPIYVSSVTLSSKYKIIHPNETMQIVATVNPSSATYKNISWSSSNNEVATINEQGLITGVSEGETTITAQASNDITKTITIKVQNVIEIEKISLSINAYDPLSLTLGKYKMTASIYPENADNTTLTFESSNVDCVSVDNNGNLDCKNDGSSLITVRAENGVSGKMTLTVPSVEATSIKINVPTGGTAMSYKMKVGQTVQLTATLFRSISSYPYLTSEGITTRELIWSSSDSSKVQISENGLVTALQSTTPDGIISVSIVITVDVKGVEGVSCTYLIDVTD